MDKLKPLIKYHFWILSSIVALAMIGVGIWSWMAAGEVISKQKATIISAEGQAKNVMNVKADVPDAAAVAVHPNDNTLQGMKQEIDAGRDEVLNAWQKLYDSQRDLLGWPGTAIDPQLAAVFDAVNPEKTPFTVDTNEGEVGERLRKQIRVALPKLMPALAEAIRAEWSEEEVTGEASKPQAVDSAQAKDDMERLMFDQPIVKWSLGDQMKWYNLLTNFKRNGNKAPDGTPRTMQIVYLKEDVVLLNGVLDIIKSANEDASIPTQAAISEVASIMIGKEAHEAKPLDVGELGGGNSFADEAAGRMSAMRDYMDKMASGGDTTETAVSQDELEAFDPANNRYVDKDFKPIPAGEYRSSVSSGQLSDKSWMAVVKRVPVRLRLKVDERRIGEILEKCANAKIPLEVRQITVIGGDLPKDTTAAAGPGTGVEGPTGVGNPSAAGSGGATATVDDGMTGGGDKEGGGMGGGDSGGEAKTYSSPEFNSHFMIPLEIYGIMKIYNEPNLESLGKKPEGDAAAL